MLDNKLQGITIELDIDDTKAREKLHALEQNFTCEHDYMLADCTRTALNGETTIILYCMHCADVQVKRVPNGS